MYSWGGSTADWKKPGSYKFDSARKPYLDKLAADAAAKGPRAYAMRSKPDAKLVDCLGRPISSDSENPLVIAVDVTGSMCTWPGEIFDRLPLLYQTLSQYRPDLEVCFAAIGDATCDNYPLQIAEFGKGLGLEDKLKALCAEGGGGGQISESYELFGWYMLSQCKTPKATSPFLLIFGDEKFYPAVNPDQVKHCIGATIQAPIDSVNVWRQLMQRFNLFYLQKPYGHGEPDVTADVKEYWAQAIGRQRIIALPSCERAVDIAMGLIAKHWGRFSDFDENMAARQDSASIASVKNSLRFLPDAAAPIDRCSRMLRSGRGSTSKPLGS